MILIMGQPGAGKSVQSELIEQRLGMTWFSTGKMFRALDDVDVQAILAKGELIDDDTVCRMVGDKLKQIGYDKTILLDGFPRTVPQAKWLLQHADEINKHVKLVVYLTVDEEVAAKRLDDRGRADDNEATRIKRNQEAQRIVPTLEFLKNEGIEIAEILSNGTVDEIFEKVSEAINPKL